MRWRIASITPAAPVLLAVLALLSRGTAPGPALAAGSDSLAGATAASVPLPFTDSTNTISHTTEGGEPLTTDCEGTPVPIGHTAWYKYTAPAGNATSLTADTAGSLYDTVLSVFSGPASSPTFASLAFVACDDDETGNITTSKVTFSAVGGTTYYFQAGGGFSDAGILSFHLDITNNALANALTASPLPYTNTLNNAHASTQGGENTVPCTLTGATVWYKYTPAADAALTADTTASSFTTVLAVYSGPAVSPAFPLPVIGCGFGSAASVTFPATGATTYYFQAGGLSTLTGNVTFRLKTSAGPANDLLGSATTVTTPLPYAAGPFNNLETGVESGENTNPCGQLGRTVWYKYAAPTGNATSLTVDTIGSSNVDTVLAVYSGPAATPTFGALSLVACDNPADMPGGSVAKLTFSAAGGTTYYFQVGSRVGDTGNLVFHLDIANNALANALTASPLLYMNSLHSEHASTEGSEPSPTCEFGPTTIGKTVWYAYTPPANQTLVADTLLSIFVDTVIAVYSGPAVSPTFGALGFVACDDEWDDSNLGVPSRLAFPAQAGTAYYFQVGGFLGSGGNLTFRLDADSDLDGFADFADNCPAVSNPDQSNADADAFGDACDTGNSDSDFLADNVEYFCGSPRNDGTKVPERIDTVGDDDGDGLFNEALPANASGFDCDGDGWAGSLELAIYAAATTANDQDPCGNNGWPVELAGNDNVLNVGDFNSFLFPLRGNGSFNKFGHPVPDPNDANIARWNLQVNAAIDIGDLNALNPAVLAPTSRPPMFGGLPAFFTNVGNGVGGCPFPP